LGVLYAGVAGAIMTGKIMRYIASASVSWSDPIILRYGGGVHVEMNESNNIKSDTEVSKHGRIGAKTIAPSLIHSSNFV
jgi:hypothetical protein